MRAPVERVGGAVRKMGAQSVITSRTVTAETRDGRCQGSEPC
jgi:hypothetical protein